jgi:hypothetical protein
MLIILAIWGAFLYRGGRRRGTISGALLLGPLTFVMVGGALAGKLNPARSRFQDFPIDDIADGALIFNISFWIVIWGVPLYFLLPRLGKRWKI